MRNKDFIRYVAIAVFLSSLLIFANDSVGSAEPDQNVNQLVKLIEKLTERIEALEQRIQFLEAQIKSLQSAKDKNEPADPSSRLKCGLDAIFWFHPYGNRNSRLVFFQVDMGSQNVVK